ncbi:MAG: cyclic nucleotide-binding domain-containing protein, partial [Vibrio litoralis]
MNNGLLPNIVSFLQTIYPFSQLPKTVLNNIAQTVDILFLSPEQQLKQNGEATYLYILRSGVIQQSYPDDSLRSMLGEEDIFGFNLHNKDSENKDSENYVITAIENTLLYRFDYPALITQLQDYPD